MPDRHAVFVEVVRVDFETADVVVAHDQFVDDQIDGRHVLRGRRHGLAEQILVGGRRNHHPGKARLQRTGRLPGRARQPGHVAGHLIRRDVRLPRAIRVRGADDHAVPVTLEQRQRADVQREAARQELRDGWIRRGRRRRDGGRSGRVFGAYLRDQRTPGVRVECVQIDGGDHAFGRQVGGPVHADRAAHHGRRRFRLVAQQIGGGERAEGEVGALQSRFARRGGRADGEAQRHRRADRLVERRGEVERKAGQIGIRRHFGQPSLRAAHVERVGRAAAHARQHLRARAVQIESARRVDGDMAAQVERIGAVLLQAAVRMHVAAEELSREPVHLRRVLGKPHLAFQLRQRRHVLDAQAVVLEADRALHADMRLRRARHGQLERERGGPFGAHLVGLVLRHDAERAGVHVVEHVGERPVAVALDDEARRPGAEVVDPAVDAGERDLLVMRPVDVEAHHVLLELEHAIDAVERRPHVRRAVLHLARRVGRRIELAALERRHDMELPGARVARIGELGQIAVHLDRRAVRHAGLQTVAQIDAQLFADAGR